MREMAEEIRKCRIRNINDETIDLANYDYIGKDWVTYFPVRNAELANVRIRRIGAACVKNTSPEGLGRWFEELKKTMEEYNILPQNMYNMDKSGFSIQSIQSAYVLVDAI